MKSENKERTKARLREGYTTGTCAAIAAKAAAKMLLQQVIVEQEAVQTPRGDTICVAIHDICRQEQAVSCAVQKDAGDDPDVTDGIFVYAKVSLLPGRAIVIDGGEGVGRVTKPGLAQAVGEAAINPVPRQMIAQAVRSVCEETDRDGGLRVEISVPQGAEIAKKTFNPRLGIVGGISILGTSGIVEPMSERALIDTIQVEMNVVYAGGVRHLVVAPGNYGEEYVKDTLHLDLKKAVKCSNYVGETIDFAVQMGFASVLFVGHVGKLIKCAAGIMNTHSHVADARMEILTAHAALQGAPVSVLEQVMACVTTEEAIRILREYPFFPALQKRVMEKIQFHLEQRSRGQLAIGAVLFSNQWGLFGKTETADALLQAIREEMPMESIQKKNEC